ncbi:hypothetical protein NE237_003892 [Protea cynaroides]|uniref:Uncharacterized protein n=1 Tax=Protea cynaroides TaxID=273540 RepID=A0A9Q0KHN6_9MAGN|nr:hypothetical protein NE237_003892 [Protea cynaroides]
MVEREMISYDHELCLKSAPGLGVVASEVRLLCDLEQLEPTWTVQHVGGTMRGAGADQISILISVTVTLVNKMPKLYAIDDAVPVTPGIQLVEVTAPASPENYIEVVAAVLAFVNILHKVGWTWTVVGWMSSI